MKIVLVALNSKYIHSNLAVYNLKESAATLDADITIKEYTINQYVRDILIDIYEEKADILAFSCYIWNISMMEELIEEIKKIQSGIEIWVGGPEVSYDAKWQLMNHSGMDVVMIGEGERTFFQLVKCAIEHTSYNEVQGIAYRRKEGILENPRQNLDYIPMDEIPFIYKNMKDFQHKIVYYETSRGCPFSCSYCLSSIDKRVRLRSLSKVYEELQFFLDQNVPQVKFVDRTFNCNKKHSQGIWNYILEHDNGITNFHFEVSEDLLGEEDFALFRQMRPGLIQLEIGVQSTWEKTIKEIRRTMNLERLRENVAKIKNMKNIHQHLDLIAGLPYEDYQRFTKSFDDVYKMMPDQLQLGFLKVLKGSYMYEKKEDYGVIYSSKPPYEVMATKWLSYDDIIELKGVEEMVEVYYNSGQFTHSLHFFESQYDRPYTLFNDMYHFYKDKGLLECKHTRLARYEILREFAMEKGLLKEKSEILDECLTYDMYLNEPVKKRPLWARTDADMKRQYQFILKNKAGQEAFLHSLKGLFKNPKENQNITIEELMVYPHIEYASKSILKEMGIGEEEGYLLFNYGRRDPLSNHATLYYIEKEKWEEFI